jgi:glycosyltransferase involved in cell wall biosynthesis
MRLPKSFFNGASIFINLIRIPAPLQLIPDYDRGVPVQTFFPSTTASPRFALIAGHLRLGGVTTFILNLAGELVRRDALVQVLGFEEHFAFQDDFARAQVPVQTQKRHLIYEDRMSRLLHQLEEFQPTHVIACLSPVSFEVLRHLPAGVVRVGMVQADWPSNYDLIGLFHPYQDIVVGVSKKIIENLSAHSTAAVVPHRYIPYGVPMPAKQPVRDHTTGQPLRILYFGRLDQNQKRVRLFVPIWRQLCESGFPFEWTIVGDGPERGYLEQHMTAGRSDQQTRFISAVAYRDIPALLERHDVFLLTSDHEGLPLSLLEAMGRGMVPVVTRLPSGIAEVVDDATGRLVEVNDPDGYARSIRWLHEHRPEMTAMAAAAYRRVQQSFSVATMTDRWLSLAQDLPARPARWPDGRVILPPLGRRPKWWFREPVRSARRWSKWILACMRHN